MECDFKAKLPTKCEALFFSAAASGFLVNNYGPKEAKPYVVPSLAAIALLSWLVMYIQAARACLRGDTEEDRAQQEFYPRTTYSTV